MVVGEVVLNRGERKRKKEMRSTLSRRYRRRRVSLFYSRRPSLIHIVHTAATAAWTAAKRPKPDRSREECAKRTLRRYCYRATATPMGSQERRMLHTSKERERERGRRSKEWSGQQGKSGCAHCHRECTDKQHSVVIAAWQNAMPLSNLVPWLHTAMRDNARTIGVLRAMAGECSGSVPARSIELGPACTHSLPLPSVCAHTMHSAHVHVMPSRSSEKETQSGLTICLLQSIWLLLSYMVAAAGMDEEWEGVREFACTNEAVGMEPSRNVLDSSAHDRASR